jgi:hypothetical protein
MNSRRRTSDLLRLDRQAIAVGAACLALTPIFFAAREAGSGPLLPSCCGAQSRQLSQVMRACQLTGAVYSGLSPNSLMINAVKRRSLWQPGLAHAFLVFGAVFRSAKRRQVVKIS